MVQLDGAKSLNRVLFIGATNRPQELDVIKIPFL